MIQLIGYEYLKILGKKTIWILLPLLLIANVVLYDKEQTKSNNFLIEHIDDYHAFEAKFRGLPADEAFRQLQQLREELKAFSALYDEQLGTIDPVREKWLADVKRQSPELIERFHQSPYARNADLLRMDTYCSELLNSQYSAMQAYRDYVGGMEKKAEDLLSVSIFHKKGTFSYRNILKTPQDFQHLIGIPLQSGLENGPVTGTQFAITDILLTVLIFLLCIYLFLQEKESGLIRLLRTNKRGRVPLVAAKLSALASITVALAIVFYGSIFIDANRLYGFGDLSRFIQSMPAFRHSSLLLTVGQYLLLFVAGKIAVCLLLAMIFAFLFILFRQAGRIYLSLVVFFGASYLAYQLIQPLSIWNLWKYINIFSFVNTFRLLCEYKNINLFGYPIQNLILSVACMAVLLIGLPAIAIWIYAKQYIAPAQQTWLALSWTILKEKLRGSGGSVRIGSHELFKFLITSKGWLILVFALLIGYNRLELHEVRYNADDNAYNVYLRVLSGEVTPAKVKFIQEEKSKFDRLANSYDQALTDYRNGKISLQDYNEQVGDLDIFAQKRKAFQRVLRQYDELKELRETRNIHGMFVNELSSDYLFNNKFRELTNAMAYSLLLLIGLSAIFPTDYRKGLIAVLRCSRKGRWPLFAVKHAIGWLTAAVLLVILYAPDYWNLQQNYNSMNWSAPLQSIRIYHDVSLRISIGGFVTLKFFLQMFGMLAVTQCVLCLSIALKKQSLSILVSSAFLLCPLLVQFAGLDFIRPYSFNQANLFFSGFAKSGSLPGIIGYNGALLLVGTCASLLSWNLYQHHSATSGVTRRWISPFIRSAKAIIKERRRR